MKTHHALTLADDNGIEILAGYDYELSPSQVEECHGEHEAGRLALIEPTSVEVIIAGSGIDLLPLMSQKQVHQLVTIINQNHE